MLRYRLITGPILIVLLLAVVMLDNRLDALQLHDGWQDLFRGKDHPPRGLLLPEPNRAAVGGVTVGLQRGESMVVVDHVDRGAGPDRG